MGANNAKSADNESQERSEPPSPPVYDDDVNEIDCEWLEKDGMSEDELIWADESDPTNTFFSVCERVNCSDDKFNLCFADWFANRMELVTQLNDIAQKLDGHHQRCNVSTITGSSIGIVGGSIGLVGLVVMPPAAVVGAAIAGAAGAGNLITGLTEFGIAKNKQKQVKQLLNMDVHKTKDLIRSIEVVCDNWKALSEVSARFGQLCSLEHSIDNDVKLFDERRSLAVLGINAKVAFAYSAKQITQDVVEGVAETTAPVAARALSHAAFAVSMLVDGFTIYSTAKNIRKGSPSQLGAELRKMAGDLDDQASKVNSTRRFLNQQRATVLSRVIFCTDAN